MENRKAIIRFDGYESPPFRLSKGIDKGCPLSGVLFQFYNTDLVEVCDLSRGEEAVAFVDNALLLARGKNLSETNERVKAMMVRQNRGLEWSLMHQCSFAIEKFRIIGFTRRQEPNPMRKPTTRPIRRSPIFLQGVKVPAVSMHKFLGVLLDQELRWKDHINYALQKG